MNKYRKDKLTLLDKFMMMEELEYSAMLIGLFLIGACMFGLMFCGFANI